MSSRSSRHAALFAVAGCLQRQGSGGPCREEGGDGHRRRKNSDFSQMALLVEKMFVSYLLLLHYLFLFFSMFIMTQFQIFYWI